MKSKLSKIDGHIIRLLFIIGAILLLALLTKPDSFFRLTNFISMERQMVEYGLMAVGVAIALISGGIDLSVVYIANLSGIIAGIIMQNMDNNAGIFLAIIVALIVGIACGIFNGVLISVLKIPAMLATLGTMQLYMGLAIIITGGRGISGLPEAFTNFGRLNLFEILPVTFLVYLVVILIASYLFNKTNFGLQVYLIGTNEHASRFTGINVKKIITSTYLISGLLASIAGLLSLARINSAKADFGSSYTMQTILIAVLGGVNPNGGKGSIIGVFLATVIVQLLSSFLNLFPQISNFYRDLIWGVSLILVLMLNHYIAKRRNRKLVQANK